MRREWIISSGETKRKQTLQPRPAPLVSRRIATHDHIERATAAGACYPASTRTRCENRTAPSQPAHGEPRVRRCRRGRTMSGRPAGLVRGLSSEQNSVKEDPSRTRNGLFFFFFFSCQTYDPSSVCGAEGVS